MDKIDLTGKVMLTEYNDQHVPMDVYTAHRQQYLCALFHAEYIYSQIRDGAKAPEEYLA